MKKIILLLIILFIIIGILVYLYNPVTKTFNLNINKKTVNIPLTPPSEKQIITPQKEATESGKQGELNFTETGNITNFDSANEKETDYWSLVYEAPGASALKVNLVFTSSSNCDMGKGKVACDPKKLKLGDRITVEGYQDGEEVTVINLKKI